MASILGSTKKDLYVVQNPERFKGHSQGTLISSLDIDSNKLKFHFNNESFNNMFVTRLSDVYVDFENSFSIVRKNTHETWTPPTQYLGHPFTFGEGLTYNDFDFKIQLFSESEVNIEPIYDDIKGYKILDSNNNPLHDLELGHFLTFKINEQSAKIHIFNDHDYELLENKIVLDSSNLITYDINVNHKFESIALSYEKTAYTDDAIDVSKIKYIATFTDKTETGYVKNSNLIKKFKFSFEEDIDKWPSVSGSKTLNINCSYIGEDDSYEFEPQTISATLTVNVEQDYVNEIRVLDWRRTSSNVIFFFNEAPSIVVPSIEKTYISGKKEIENDDTKVIKVPFGNPSDVLYKKQNLTVSYLSEGHTSTFIIGEFDTYAKVTLATLTGWLNQYTGKKINFIGVSLNVNYNNSQTRTSTISSLPHIESAPSDLENGIWKDITSNNKIEDISFKYVDSNSGQSYIINVQLTLYKTKPESFVLDYDEPPVFTAGSSYTGTDRYKFPIIVTYNNGDTLKTIPMAFVNTDDSEFRKYDSFKSTDDFSLLLKNAKLKLQYFGVDSLEVDYKIERFPVSVLPFKSDESNYSFMDDVPVLNRKVKIDSLSKIKFVYNDSSEAYYNLSSSDKITELKNNNITLLKEYWGLEHKQVNRIEYINAYYVETVTFATKVSTVDNIYCLRSETLFQGESVADSLDKLSYQLTYYNYNGSLITRTFYYDDLEELEVSVSCPGIETWPTSETSSEESSTATVTFLISSTSNPPAFAPIAKDVDLYFMRKPVSLLINDGNDNWSDTFEIDTATCGLPITLSDYGTAQKVLFTNGYEETDVDISSFKTFEELDGKIISVWPVSGQFYLVYDEFNDLNNSVYATIICDESNFNHIPTKITVAQKNNNLIAGEAVTIEDLDIKIYGLLGEEIENIDPEDIVLTNTATETTDTFVNVNVSYESLITQVKVNLLSKICQITYNIDCNGTSLNNIAKIAAKYTYTPSTEDQKLPLVIDIPIVVNSENIYTYDTIAVSGSSVSGFDYDLISKELTIPAHVDTDLEITVKYTTDFVIGEDHHAYRVNSNSELVAVYDMEGATDEYVIPAGIVTILCSRDAFYASKSIRKLTIPSTLKQIKRKAFLSCTYLEEIVFKNRESGNVLSIERQAFQGCYSLETLDFSECGTITDGRFLFGTSEDTPFENVNISKDTWEECSLRTIKLDQSNFAKYVRFYCIPSKQGNNKVWLTGRCGGGFIMQVDATNMSIVSISAETYMTSVNYPANETTSPTGADVVYLLALTPEKCQKQFMTYDNSLVHYQKIMSDTKLIQSGYDFRNRCAGSIRSSKAVPVWLACLGLGSYTTDKYNYVINTKNDFKFTTNGRDGFTTNNLKNKAGLEFVSTETGSYGQHFGNWNNMAYVNYCIYPNVRLEDNNFTHKDFTDDDLSNFLESQGTSYNSFIGGTCLDLMIPIFNKD